MHKPALEGAGLGLRPQHYTTILKSLPPVPWFEALTENYMDTQGKPLFFLDQIRSHYPLALHGVSMSIGSTQKLNLDYLKKLKNLIHRYEPEVVSDHLCFTGTQGLNLHDLFPLPYTQACIHHVVERIKQVQDILGRHILIENVSSYIDFKTSHMREGEFLNEIAQRADCFILLDVNNIYVSSFNFKLDPHVFLSDINPARVRQFHLAGHTRHADYIIDTHSDNVCEEVWDLYTCALKRFGPVPTLIEWDENIPPFEVLFSEAQKANERIKRLKHAA